MPGVLVAALIAAAPADAQSGEAARRAAPLPTQVQLSIDSGYEAIGSTTIEGTAPPANAALRLRAELTHARVSRRASVSVWSGVTADQGMYGTTGGNLAEAVRVNAGLQLNRRTRLELAEYVSRAPLDLFTVFGSVGVSSAQPVVSSPSGLTGVTTLAHDTRVSLTRTLGPRSVFGLTATEAGSSGADDRGVRTRSVTAQISRKSGPFTAWHAGYGVGTADSAGLLSARRIVRHDLDAGLDYSRPLPFWRNTTMTFGTGSTLLATDEGRQFRLNLTAAVERQVSAGWRTRVEFSRPIEFVPGFADPFLSDAVRFSLDGRPARRLTVSVTGGYARGSTGFGAGGTGFTSSVATVRVARVLAPEWRAEAEWNSAWYGFAAASSLPVSIPGRFTRLGTRVRLVWSPAIVR